jgi:ABC-2 type transport system permease protein
MNALTPYWVLVKREIWEHKSLWIVQLVLLCLAVLGAVWGSGALLVASHHGLFSLSDMQSGVTIQDRTALVHDLVVGSAFGANIFMLFVACFYLMDCLYADRRDRSVFFWRSMPVSDSRMVLAKLFTGMVVAPAIMLAQVIVAEILIGVTFTIAFALLGVNLLGVFFLPGTIILAWITLAFALLVQSLWFLPFYGWFLLCSAWAKKLPLAWTVLIPLGAMLLELITLRTTYIGRGIFGHIGRWFGAFFIGRKGFNFHDMNMTPGMHVMTPESLAGHGSVLMTFGSVASYLARPEMWIGVGIGIIFILGAVWLRHNRSEI